MTLLSRPQRRSARLVTAVILVMVTAGISPSHAADATWDGGGGDNLWSTAGNWVGDTAPVPGDGLIFAGSTTSNSNDFAAGTQFNGITLAAGSSPFSLAGNAINLGGDVTNLDNDTLTLASTLGITLLQDTVFNASAGAISVSGGIGGVGFGLTKTGTSTLTLGTTLSTYTGATSVERGTLALSFANTAGTTSADLISSSSNLQMGGGGIGPAVLTATSKTASTNTQTFNNTTVKFGLNTITLARAAASGSMTMDLGAITRNGGGLLAVTAGTNGALGSTVFLQTSNVNSNGIMGGWATAGNDWATKTANGVEAYTGYSTLGSLGGNLYNITSDATSNLRIDSSSSYAVGNATYPNPTSQITVAGASGILAVGDSISGPRVVSGTTVSALAGDVVTLSKTINVNGNPVPTSFTGDITGAKTVTLANSGYTELNTIQVTDTSNRVIDLGAGNTLRLGASGGIWRQTAVSTTGLTFNNGTITAGGPVLDAAGEIVFRTGGDSASAAYSSGSRHIEGMVINSAISDNGTGKVSLIKTGYERLVLNGANTYTGDTHVLQSILISNTINNLGGTGATVYALSDGTTASGAVWLYGGGDYTNNWVISGNGTSVTPSTVGFNYGAISINNLNTTLSGTITLAGDARIGSELSSYPAQGFLISGKITGNYGLTFGSGSQRGVTVKLSNTTNDWGGDLSLGISATTGQSVTLWLGASEVLPHGVGKGDIRFNKSQSGNIAPTLNLNGFNETVNALISGGTDITVSRRIIRNNHATEAATLTMGASGSSGTFYGTVQNGAAAALSLTKIGSGTQGLQGNLTYTGATMVNGGVLLISDFVDPATMAVTATNMTGTSGITVNNTGTFAYTGSNALDRNVTANSGGTFRYSSAANYSGTMTLADGARLAGTNWNGNLNGLTIANGSSLAPGNSVGQANTGSQNWGNGGSLEFEINAAVGLPGFEIVGWDHIAFSDTLNISGLGVGGFTIELHSQDFLDNNEPGALFDFDPLSNYAWEFASFASLTGTFNASYFDVDTTNFDNATNGTFSVSQVGNTLVLNYTAVPEPGVALLLVGGASACAFVRRKRAHV